MDEKRIEALKNMNELDAKSKLGVLRSELLTEIGHLKGVSLVLNLIDVREIHGTKLSADNFDHYFKRLDRIAKDMESILDILIPADRQ